MNYGFGDQKVKIIAPWDAGSFLRAIGFFLAAIVWQFRGLGATNSDFRLPLLRA